MRDDAALMNRFTLRFADVDLEASFAEEQARKSQRPFRIVLLWTGVIVLITWALAGIIFPHVPNAHARIALPMIVVLGNLALGLLTYALLRSGWRLRN